MPGLSDLLRNPRRLRQFAETPGNYSAALDYASQGQPQSRVGRRPASRSSQAKEDEPNTLETGEVIEQISLPDGSLVKPATESGRLVKAPGKSNLYLDPTTGEPYNADPSQPSGLRSAWQTATKKARDGKIYASISGVGEREIGPDPKVAEDAAKREAENRRLALAREKRPYNIDRVTGEPVPLQTDEEWAAAKQAKAAKLDEAARVKRLKDQADVIDLEADRINLTAPKPAKEDEEAFTAAESALSQFAAGQDMEEVAAKYAAAPATDEASQQAKAAAENYLAYKDKVKPAKEAEKKVQELKLRALDIKEQIINPQKWKEGKTASLAALPDDDLVAEVQAQAEIINEQEEQAVGTLDTITKGRNAIVSELNAFQEERRLQSEQGLNAEELEALNIQQARLEQSLADYDEHNGEAKAESDAALKAAADRRDVLAVAGTELEGRAAKQAEAAGLAKAKAETLAKAKPLYEGWAKGLYAEDWRNEDSPRLEQEAKKAGLDVAQAKEALQTYRQLDWSNTRRDPKTAKPIAEESRTLPDGNVTVNPTMWGDAAAYQKAVEASQGTPEGKAKALEAFPKLQEIHAEKAVEILSQSANIPGADNFIAWRERKIEEDQATQGKLGFARQSPAKQAIAYMDEMKNRSWFRKAGEQVAMGLLAGFQDIATQALGVGGMVTGSETLADLAAANSENTQSVVGAQNLEGSDTDYALRVMGMGARMTPAVAAMISGAGAVGGGLGTAAVLAGGQSAGSMFADLYRSAKEDAGLSHGEAWKKAALPAALAGTITGLLTRGMGATGLERVFSDTATQETARNTFKAMLGQFVKGAAEELPEEIADEYFTTILQESAASADPVATLKNFANTLPELAGVTALMGGAGALMQARRQAGTEGPGMAPPPEGEAPAMPVQPRPAGPAPTPEGQPATIEGETGTVIINTDLGNIPNDAELIYDSTGKLTGWKSPDATLVTAPTPAPETPQDVVEQIAKFNPTGATPLPQSVAATAKRTGRPPAAVARQAASGVVKIAQGQSLENLDIEEQEALGFVNKGGKIVPADNKVTPLVYDYKGKPVLRTAAAEWLTDEAQEGLAGLVQLTEAERKAQIDAEEAAAKAKPAAKKKAGQATAAKAESTPQAGPEVKTSDSLSENEGSTPSPATTLDAEMDRAHAEWQAGKKEVDDAFNATEPHSKERKEAREKRKQWEEKNGQVPPPSSSNPLSDVGALSNKDSDTKFSLAGTGWRLTGAKETSIRGKTILYVTNGKDGGWVEESDLTDQHRQILSRSDEPAPANEPETVQLPTEQPQGQVPEVVPVAAEQPPAPAQEAPLEPTPAASQPAEPALTPTQADQMVRAQAEYDSAMRAANADPEPEIREKKKKAAGMRFSAAKRIITGKLTAKEAENKAKREASNFEGKAVSVDGKNGEVVGNAFGKVKVKFTDGTKAAVPADKVKPPVEAGPEAAAPQEPAQASQKEASPATAAAKPPEQMTPEEWAKANPINDPRDPSKGAQRSGGVLEQEFPRSRGGVKWKEKGISFGFQEHARQIQLALNEGKSVSAQAVSAYLQPKFNGIILPTGYIQDGDLYVYRPEARPAPASQEAGLAEARLEVGNFVRANGKGPVFKIESIGADGWVYLANGQGSYSPEDAAKTLVKSTEDAAAKEAVKGGFPGFDSKPAAPPPRPATPEGRAEAALAEYVAGITAGLKEPATKAITQRKLDLAKRLSARLKAMTGVVDYDIYKPELRAKSGELEVNPVGILFINPEKLINRLAEDFTNTEKARSEMDAWMLHEFIHLGALAKMDAKKITSLYESLTPEAKEASRKLYFRGKSTQFNNDFQAAHEWFAQQVEAILRGEIANSGDIKGLTDPTLRESMIALLRDFVAQLRDIAATLQGKNAKLAAEIRAQAEAVGKIASDMAAKAGLEIQPKAEETQNTDPNIGREWDSEYGRQRIIERDDRGIGSYIVQTVGTDTVRHYGIRRIDEEIRHQEYRITPEYAAEQEEKKARAERQSAADLADQEAAALAAEQVNSYYDDIGLSPMQKGKMKAALDQSTGRRNSETKREYVGPRYTVVEQMVEDGYKPQAEQAPAIKELTGIQINRMNERQQRDYEKKKAAAGSKTEYQLKLPSGNYFVVTKAEYDYAKWLQAKAGLELGRAEGGQAEAKPELTPEQRQERAQTIRDMMVTNRENKKPIPQGWVNRLAELEGAPKAQEGEIYSNVVEGHPQHEVSHSELQYLIPIKISKASDLDSKFERAQALLDKWNKQIGVLEYQVKNAKTPALRKKAMSDLAKLGSEKDARDILRDTIIPELDRLAKEIASRQPPAPPAVPEVARRAGSPVGQINTRPLEEAERNARKRLESLQYPSVGGGKSADKVDKLRKEYAQEKAARQADLDAASAKLKAAYAQNEPQSAGQADSQAGAEAVPDLTPPQAAAVAKEEAMPEPAKQAAPFDAAAAKGQKKFLLAEVAAAVKAAPRRSEMTQEQKDTINLLESLPTALEKASTKPEGDRLRLSLDAAKADAERLIGYVTIEVPGDGTFTILNEKGALAQFQKRADKFPVSQSRDDLPAKPTAQAPTAVPALKKPKTTADVVQAMFPMVSTDTTRVTVLQKVKGDGTYLWASDGRVMVRVEQENGGGKGAENVIYDEKGNAQPVPADERNPSMEAVIPNDKAFPSYTLDTARWFSLMSQARAVIKDLPGDGDSGLKSVSLYRNPDGSLGVFASDVNRGDYAHNIQPEAQILAAYSPDYFQTILRVARNLGNEQIELRIQDDVSPATLRAGKALFVLMPMRVNGAPAYSTARPAPPVTAEPSPAKQTREEAAEAARAIAGQDPSIPPPPPDDVETLQALRDRANRRPYKPDKLTPARLAVGIRAGWVTKTKEAKLTEKGYSQLAEWEQQQSAHDRALGALSDKLVDEAVSKWDRKNDPTSWEAINAARQPSPAAQAPAEAPEAGKAAQAPAEGGQVQAITGFDSARAFIGQLRKGEVTAEQVRTAWAQLKAQRPAILADLNKMKVDELLPMAGMSARKSDGKASIAKSVLGTLDLYFNPDDSISYSYGGNFDANKDAAMDEKVAKWTDEMIVEQAKARSEAAEASKAAKEKALTNPETAEEWDRFVWSTGRKAMSEAEVKEVLKLKSTQARNEAVRKKGESLLAPEQLAAYDAVRGIDRKAAEQARTEAKSRVYGVTSGVEADIIETKHTQKGHDLFVVKLSERVERPVYDSLNAASKKLGGYYSSYAKGGAVPGFQFTTRAAAENFIAVSKGETVDQKEQIQERQEAKKSTTAARLTAVAEALDGKADGILNADRKTNTAKRAREAAGQEATARKMKAMAATMRNLAAAMESGEATHLDGVRMGTHVETLDSMARGAMTYWIRDRKMGMTDREKTEAGGPTAEMMDATRIPYPYLDKGDMLRLVEKGRETPGAKLLAERVAKIRMNENDGQAVTLRTDSELDDVKELAQKVTERGKPVWDAIKWKYETYDRLKAMGLTNLPSLRAALREFLQYRGQAAKADPIKAMERELIGMKLPGFFPTPRPVIDEMIGMAGIEPGMKVLEPSAGKGDIAEAAQEAGAEVDTIELSIRLQDILKAKGLNVIDSDFTSREPVAEYDAVVMNPPFENGQDMEHIQHAYKFLKPGGKLVAIMSAGPFYRQDKQATAFREWLDGVDGSHEAMPEGSFAGSDAFRQTGVRTEMVTITKPADKGQPAGLGLPPSPDKVNAAVEAVKNANSTGQAEPILNGLSVEELKQVAKATNYPSTGSKKDLVSRLLNAVSFRASARAIMGDAKVPNAPIVERTPEQQIEFMERRRQEREAADLADANAPRPPKPDISQEAFNRRMEAIRPSLALPPGQPAVTAGQDAESEAEPGQTDTDMEAFIAEQQAIAEEEEAARQALRNDPDAIDAVQASGAMSARNLSKQFEYPEARAVYQALTAARDMLGGPETVQLDKLRKWAKETFESDPEKYVQWAADMAEDNKLLDVDEQSVLGQAFQFLTREARLTGDKNIRALLNKVGNYYLDTGTRLAQAMSARRDPLETPQERWTKALDIVFGPSEAVRRKLRILPTQAGKARRIASLEAELAEARGSRRADVEAALKTARAQETKEELLEKDDAESQKIKERVLKNIGVTEDDLMLSGTDRVALQSAILDLPAVKAGLEAYKGKDNDGYNIMRLAFRGFSDEHIANALNLNQDDVGQFIHDATNAIIRPAVAEQVKAGTGFGGLIKAGFARLKKAVGLGLPPRLAGQAALDKEYMDAVEAGDMEKAQRMVDEAAKAAIEASSKNAVSFGRFLSKSEYEAVREQIEPLPRKVFYVGNVEVIRNPTGEDIRGMTNEERSARGGRKSVDPDTRFTHDNYGNTWRWKATGGMHSMIEPSISKQEGVSVNQNNGIPYHSDLVKDAIRSGEYIPSKTLAEYPNYADFVKPSASDPVTRDKSGKVIPLSERFPGNPSLRNPPKAIEAQPALLGGKRQTVADVTAEVNRVMAYALQSAKARNSGKLMSKVVMTPGGQRVRVFVPFDPDDMANYYAFAREYTAAKASAFDKVYEYWINWPLLSGPQTQVANITGNAAQVAWHYTGQRLAEATLNLAYQDPNAPQFREFKHILKGFWQGIGPAFEMARQTFLTEGDTIRHKYLGEPMQIDMVDGDLDKVGNIRASVGGQAGRISHLPGRVLRFTDAFFKTAIMYAEASAVAYRRAHVEAKRQGLKGQARADFIDTEIANTLNDTSSAVWGEVMKTAEELLFQDENMATEIVDTALGGYKGIRDLEKLLAEAEAKGDSELAAKLQKRIRSRKFVGSLMRWIFPFQRTPTNIVRAGIKKAGGSAISLLYGLTRAGWLAMGKDGVPMIKSYPKAMQIKDASETLLAGLGWLALASMLEGDDNDDEKPVLLVGTRSHSLKERAATDQFLRKYGGENSIVWQDGKGKVLGSLPFGRYEPAATLLTTWIDAYRNYQEVKRLKSQGENASYSTYMLSSLVSSLEDKSFLQGFANAMQFVRDVEEKRENPDQSAGVKMLMNNVIPNLIKQPLRNMDDVLRERTTAGPGYAALPNPNMAPKLPVFAAQPKISTTGERLPKAFTPPARLLFQANTKVTPQPDALLYRANRLHPTKRWSPQPLQRDDYNADPPGKAKPVPIIDPAKKRQFAELAGRLYAANAAKVAAKAMPSEQAAPGESLIKAFKKAREDAMAAARAQAHAMGLHKATATP